MFFKRKNINPELQQRVAEVEAEESQQQAVVDEKPKESVSLELHQSHAVSYTHLTLPTTR